MCECDVTTNHNVVISRQHYIRPKRGASIDAPKQKNKKMQPVCHMCIISTISCHYIIQGKHCMVYWFGTVDEVQKLYI